MISPLDRIAPCFGGAELGVRHGLASARNLLQLEDQCLSELMKIRFYPLVLERADGVWLEDVDGNVFLDLSAGASTMNVGYRNERVQAAVTSAMQRTWSTSAAVVAHRDLVLLADRLSRFLPGASKVWFGTSGSEALDMLARFARAATGRSRIVSFLGADHGQTSASAAISGLGFHGLSEDPVTRVPYPYPYRCPHGPCASAGCSLNCLREVEDALGSGDRPAAVFFEPIQANGGDVIPPRNVLPALRELCDAAGALLILDEVKVGLGRSGRMFAHEHSDVEPDAIALGKALAGGLPLSAVIGSPAILDQQPGGCAMTLAGSPIPCAAALATLDELEARRLVENAAEVGRDLLDGLRRALEDSPVVGDVRGQGLILGVEIVTSRDLREPARELAARIAYRCFELGVVLIYTGINGNVLELTPPLVFSRDEASTATGLIAQAIEEACASESVGAEAMHFAGW